jgi:hypothetical protein
VGRQTTPGTFDPGEGLGPIGGRIVAEVIVGLLETDEDSYPGQDRSWQPGLLPPPSAGDSYTGQLPTAV